MTMLIWVLLQHCVYINLLKASATRQKQSFYNLTARMTNGKWSASATATLRLETTFRSLRNAIDVNSLDIQKLGVPTAFPAARVVQGSIISRSAKQLRKMLSAYTVRETIHLHIVAVRSMSGLKTA